MIDIIKSLSIDFKDKNKKNHISQKENFRNSLINHILSSLSENHQFLQFYCIFYINLKNSPIFYIKHSEKLKIIL